MKILLSCESDIIRELVTSALEAAGHHVKSEASFAKLEAFAVGGDALLIDRKQAKSGIARLRDKKFNGPALLLADGDHDELFRLAAEAGADGALATSPPEDLAQRFSIAALRRKRVL